MQTGMQVQPPKIHRKSAGPPRKRMLCAFRHPADRRRRLGSLSCRGGGSGAVALGISASREKRDAPERRQTYQRINDAGDDRGLSAAQPRDNVKPEKTNASPVDPADDGENQCDSVYYDHVSWPYLSSKGRRGSFFLRGSACSAPCPLRLASGRRRTLPRFFPPEKIPLPSEHAFTMPGASAVYAFFRRKA